MNNTLFWKIEHLLNDLDLYILILWEMIISQIPMCCNANDTKIGRFYCNKKRLQWIILGCLIKDAKHLQVSLTLFIYLWFQFIENGFNLVDCCSWLLFVGSFCFWISKYQFRKWSLHSKKTKNQKINLFTTSESPKIRIPIVQIFCFDFFNDSATNNLR